MKTLATTLRHAMLTACCLLGALVSAGGQGYMGGQGYSGSQSYSGWLSFPGGAGFTDWAGVTDSATSSAQAPSSAHLPHTVELTASRLRYRSPTAESRPRVIRPFEKPGAPRRRPCRTRERPARLRTGTGKSGFQRHGRQPQSVGHCASGWAAQHLRTYG